MHILSPSQDVTSLPSFHFFQDVGDVAPQQERPADYPAPPFLLEGVVSGGYLARSVEEEQLVGYDSPPGLVGMCGPLDPPVG